MNSAVWRVAPGLESRLELSVDLGSPTYQGLQPWDTDLSFLFTLLSTISPSPFLVSFFFFLFLVSSTMWMTTKYFGLSVP